MDGREYGLRSPTRRGFLRHAGCGFGAVALNAMLAQAAPASVRVPQYPARAKRVIFLFMAGGPSQHELFDPKPKLTVGHGQRIGLASTDLPKGFAPGVDKYLTLGPFTTFKQHGQSGLWLSNLMPELAKVADEICLLKGMKTDNSAHSMATLQMHTGVFLEVRPSMGAWIDYGLGTENQNMPGFVSIHAGDDTRAYGSAFLPAIHQGTVIRSIPKDPKESAIRFLNDPKAAPDAQRRRLDLLASMNRRTLSRIGQDQQMEGLIQSFELAFRMQAQTPRLVDLSDESKETLELYGVGDGATDHSAKACLLARRMSESGVRFVQVTIGGWDHHGDIRHALPNTCRSADKPVAALLIDLKRRGMLDETLVVWSGEFGRTPWSQDLSGKSPIESHGREHQPDSFCTWLAGGGVKGGFIHGQTDDFGYQVVEGATHVHDLHATMLHLLGIHHEQLTYRHAGRDFRLTDVHGQVIHEILA